MHASHYNFTSVLVPPITILLIFITFKIHFNITYNLVVTMVELDSALGLHAGDPGSIPGGVFIISVLY